MPSLQFDNTLLKKAFQFLKVLDNKTRIEILKTIHSKSSMTVTELYTALNQEQSYTSQHLGFLKKAGFVNTSRKGKYIHYTIDYTLLDFVNSSIKDFVKAPVKDIFNKDVRLALSRYNTYVLEMMDVYKPISQKNDYEGMLAWLKSFSQMLEEYNAATLKSKRDILQETENNLEADLTKLRTELEKIRTHALHAFIKRYKG